MSIPRTNIHMHVFISKCAPPNFLRIKRAGLVKVLACPLKILLENKRTRKLITRLNNRRALFTRKRRIFIDRYISFLYTTGFPNQLKVFQQSLKTATQYEENPRLVAQTLDMDYMDNQSTPIIRYNTQLYEVLSIKRDFPDNFFPFLGVDPRARSSIHLLNWAKPHFIPSVKGKEPNGILWPLCSGIKLYPAHGFFPFDPSLDELYAFAEKENIPLMFHCTRVGSQYIGSNIEGLIPKQPQMIMPDTSNSQYAEANTAQQEIYARISRYYKEGWVKNSKIGRNEYACDLFSHPMNYVPILVKYPKLKICMAHMGGAEEVACMNPDSLPEKKRQEKPDKDLRKIWKLDGHNWAVLIRDMMVKYPCFFTDISSTISELDNPYVSKNINDWLNTNNASGTGKLGDRILFGTDFYMTEQEKPEPDLYGLLRKQQPDWFERMSRDNIKNYMGWRG